MPWPKGRPRSPETIAKLSKPTRPAEERFWEKVDKRGPDDCWPWIASVRADGYGSFGSPFKRGNDVAHRIAWQFTHGPIPDGTYVDHACHNEDPDCPGGACAHRACQNPAHMRLVTNVVNVMAGKGFAPTNAAKTQCEQGHPFDSANTYVRPDGWRDCRRCKAEAQARYRQRKSQE